MAGGRDRIAAGGVGSGACLRPAPLLPVGLAGVAEPHPGLDADGRAFAIAGLATALVTVACAVPSAWRSSASELRQARFLSRTGATGRSSRWPWASVQPRDAGCPAGPAARRRPNRAAGPERDRGRGHRRRRAVRGHGVLRQPRPAARHPPVYGVTWDAVISSTNTVQVTPVARIVARDQDVAAWSVGNSDAPLRVNSISVGGIVMSSGRGPSLMAARLSLREAPVAW